MPWIVDGNNVLGRAGAPRDAVDSKRQLVRALGGLARAKQTKIYCYFDGPEPEHFGKQLGGVSVTFSGTRSADELIAKRAASGDGWKLVTSDRALAARLRSRHVEIVDPQRLMQELESLPPSEERVAADDWMSYFSDPKNRNVF